MFWLLFEEAGKAAEPAVKHGAEAAHHTPVVVEMVNQYLGPFFYRFEITYTRPVWNRIFGWFGTNAEAVFGPYTPENAIPWYTIMFIIACAITLLLIWVLKGKLTQDEPEGGQQTLEVAVLALRGLLEDVVGPHGLKYFPVVATFAILILVSNLMGLVPFLLPPTTSTSVTFALGISSFAYYNYISIKENGFFGHIKHLAGFNYFGGIMLIVMALPMFFIELISNAVRPMSLGLRLFGNLFGDEQVGANVSALYPPYTYVIVPAMLLVLSVFAAFMQTFIFTLLSMIYIGEVSHAPHEDHGDGTGHPVDGNEIIAPALT
jgi:F-type H+-transporting ATPase subunit a